MFAAGKGAATLTLKRAAVQPQHRSPADVLFIRDRLHETSAFFRMFPSQLQQLLARIASPRVWALHEVAAAAEGAPPREVVFILQGEVGEETLVHTRVNTCAHLRSCNRLCYPPPPAAAAVDR
jgi:hypothetical protein